MKTFISLRIDETFYRINSTCRSDVKKGKDSLLEEIKVQSLSKEDGFLFINKKRNYNGDWCWDARIPESEINGNYHKEKEKYYFTEKFLANSFIRDIVVGNIREHEDSIEERKKDIQNLREKYLEILS